MKIYNLGSLNIDYVYDVDHFVTAGETLLSENLSIFPGGKGLNQSVALARAGVKVIHGATFGFDPTTWVAEGYEATKENGVWTVKPYEVSTATEIEAEALKAALLADAADGVINIDRDYAVTGDWTSLYIPTGSPYAPIADEIVVNGNGHTISGLTTSLLHGSVAGKVTINDLTIKDSTIAPTDTNDLGNGAFIAYRTNTGGGSLTMTNCHAVNVTVNSNENAGALVGYCSSVDPVAFTNCTVANHRA